MNTFERNFGKCFILECAYTLECSKIYGVPKLLALQYKGQKCKWKKSGVARSISIFSTFARYMYHFAVNCPINMSI